MSTIQDKLSVLAGTIEDSSVSQNQSIEEEKKKVTAVDFKMVTFSLAGKDYAIDIMKVKEIAKAGNFTYVPNILPFVRGVYNLRGDIIPIIDFRLFFNIEVEEKGDDYLENMLIISVGDRTFGVVVDVIDKVIGIQKSSIQPPHPLFGDINIKYIYGVVEAEKRLYILLDIDKIFDVRSPEEEKVYVESMRKQMQARQIKAETPASETQEKDSAKDKANQKTEPEAANAKNEDNELRFISESLLSLKKFVVNEITDSWVKSRYKEWLEEKGRDNVQLQSESDADEFLAPFYSKYTSSWWTEEYAKEVFSVLPENSAKNIVVWNPGCGKGFETYSLACLLSKKYRSSRIRVYGHDTDLLSVSNAPLMNLTDEAANDWYQPFTMKTVTGEYTFSIEIKDSVMFEYHDCGNTNNLPPIDIIFARDLISFMPEPAQQKLLQEFSEKVKGNGIIIVGENENIELPGWVKKSIGKINVYSKA